MTGKHRPAINALDIDARTGSGYPPPFRKAVAARSKRALGDALALNNFGANLVTLPPGAWSSQRHWHTREDELVYVLSGELTLVTDDGRQVMTPGMVAGFPANIANGHHLVNTGDTEASYIEIGDRNPEDEAYYPDIDLAFVVSDDGERIFTHRDGKPYI